MSHLYPVDRLRVGICGTGFIAAVHAAAWRACDVDVVAFLQRDANSSVEDLVEPGVSFFVDDDDGLDKFLDAVDVVDICAPTDTHERLAIRASEAGKPTMCEKPLALSLESASRIVNAFTRAGVAFLVAHVVRFDSAYATLRAHASELGALSVLRLTRRSFAPQRGAASWFRDDERSGGIAFDLMIHDLDYAQWLAGPVAQVTGRVADEGPGHAHALLRHNSGALSVVQASWCEPEPVFRTSAEVFGLKGSLWYDSARTAPVSLGILDTHEAGSVGFPDIATVPNPFETEIRHFLDVIAGRTDPLVTGVEACAAVAIAEAVRESSRTKQMVKL